MLTCSRRVAEGVCGTAQTKKLGSSGLTGRSASFCVLFFGHSADAADNDE